MAYDRDPVYRRHDTTSGSVLLVTQYDIVDVAVIADRMTTGGISNVDALWCWGYNNYGQVGDNSTYTQPLPVAIGQPGLIPAKSPSGCI